MSAGRKEYRHYAEKICFTGCPERTDRGSNDNSEQPWLMEQDIPVPETCSLGRVHSMRPGLPVLSFL